MSNLPSQRVRRRLELRRRDFEQVTGRPFQHFYCPILAVDEPAKLIQGHIVNQSIEGATGAWDVQRADVDNFYGAYFESGFELLQHRERATPYNLLTDKELSKKFKPMILKNGEPVPFSSQPCLPANFIRMSLGGGENPPVIGLKMSIDEAIASRGESWEFAVFSDSRISTLVSLLKAAHLTLFHLLGYRYAISAAGAFVGRDILGRFFKANDGRPKTEILHNAWAYFREFEHMIRPVQSGFAGYEGTVTDRKILVCHGTSGQFWGLIVFVKAASQLHAVMLPAFDSAQAVPTFLGFLRNDNERIHVSHGEFDPANACWTISADRVEQHWTKQGILYPHSPVPSRFPPPEFFNAGG